MLSFLSQGVSIPCYADNRYNIATAKASVRPSVCLSVTSQYSIKTTQARITES